MSTATGRTTKATPRAGGAMSNISDSVDTRLTKLSDNVEKVWDNVCDYIEEHNRNNIIILWICKNFLRRLTIEAPVVIGFSVLCIVIHILNITVVPGLNTFLAVHDTFNIYSIMQIPRLFTHVIAHDNNINHIKGNLMNLLLVGPSAEYVFGSTVMLVIFIVVAIVSALVHILVGSNYTHQLGASGIVFCVILLNSLVGLDKGEIPITFVLTVLLWVSDEFIKIIYQTDNMSHHAHITGAIVGTIAAYYYKGSNSTSSTGTTNPSSTSLSTLRSLFTKRNSSLKVKSK